ncbi:hypothetical protein WOLCODRAFT_142002 [Wolfiporia cocos MD-104 SS10]|uniref:Uncharacterized protein n=1 Tax=Wolfiporia cocos (strain MD-104) TaxID=742152 RepID=A0A2H3IXJ5_WOLCO|nr:hypothetical protein WOLCODRAFT_142002 [Wolfiporia cocos MD-104 SS10]
MPTFASLVNSAQSREVIMLEAASSHTSTSANPSPTKPSVSLHSTGTTTSTLSTTSPLQISTPPSFPVPATPFASSSLNTTSLPASTVTSTPSSSVEHTQLSSFSAGSTKGPDTDATGVGATRTLGSGAQPGSGSYSNNSGGTGDIKNTPDITTAMLTAISSGSRGIDLATTSTSFSAFVTSITLTSTSTSAGLSGTSKVFTTITATFVTLSTVSIPETTMGRLPATHTGSSSGTSVESTSHSPSRLPQILGGVLGTFGTLFLLFLAYRRHCQKQRMERFKNIRVRSVQHTPSLAPADVPLRPPRPVSTASSAFLMAESHTDSLEFASATGGNLDGDAMTSSPPPARLRDEVGVSGYLTPADNQQMSEVPTNRAVLPNPYDAFPWANVGADVARRSSARSEICDDSGMEPVAVMTGYAV